MPNLRNLRQDVAEIFTRISGAAVAQKVELSSMLTAGSMPDPAVNPELLVMLYNQCMIV